MNTLLGEEMFSGWNTWVYAPDSDHLKLLVALRIGRGMEGHVELVHGGAIAALFDEVFN